MPLHEGPPPPSAFPTYLSAAALSCRTQDAAGFPKQGDVQTAALGGHRTKYLEGHTSYLRCACCAADLCPSSQIISKGFTGRHGRAYLVSATPMVCGSSTGSPSSSTASLPNTVTQKPMPRQLVTGAHTVSDISCISCGTVLGWKYVAAEEESQRYKIGKFILETKRINTSSCWESQGDGAATSNGVYGHKQVEFDSQDEDECEDLFSGMWNPALAVRRRQRGALGPEDFAMKKAPAMR